MTRAQAEEFLELKRHHDRFLANYRSMQFDEAANDLVLLKKTAPPQLAKVYSEYQGRLDAYRVSPPSAGWDGSYRAEHK